MSADQINYAAVLADIDERIAKLKDARRALNEIKSYPLNEGTGRDTISDAPGAYKPLEES